MTRLNSDRKDLKRFKINQGTPSASYAKKALPVLVKRTLARQTITYGDLCSKVGKNGSRFSYKLDLIIDDLRQVGDMLGIEIPPLTILVVDKKTRVPELKAIYDLREIYGKYFKHFPGPLDDLEPTTIQGYMHPLNESVFDFDRWNDVIVELGLEPIDTGRERDFLPHGVPINRNMGTGESEEHKRLKQFVAEHPHVIGLPSNYGYGTLEAQFYSKDTPDVLFKHPKEWVAVEVKADNADEQEIFRGLFQCVKYSALLSAQLKFDGKNVVGRVLLVLEGSFPSSLRQAKELLGIEVFDNINPK